MQSIAQWNSPNKFDEWNDGKPSWNVINNMKCSPNFRGAYLSLKQVWRSSSYARKRISCVANAFHSRKRISCTRVHFILGISSSLASISSEAAASQKKVEPKTLPLIFFFLSRKVEPSPVGEGGPPRGSPKRTKWVLGVRAIAVDEVFALGRFSR